MKADNSTIFANGRDCEHGQLARSCEICELQADLLLMMQSRKVLWQGLGKILMATGHYQDCQERGGRYPLKTAMQDVMDAARDTWVEFNRMMDGALDDI